MNINTDSIIRVAKIVSCDSPIVAFEVSGRTPDIRTRHELEAFLDRLKDEVLDSFRME